MISWKNCVNRSAGQERIQNIQNYLICANSMYIAPIDRFYLSTKKIVAYGNDLQMLTENDFLGPLLYVGIISNTENYIREIIAECIKMCPICKKETASHNVSLGSIIWNKDLVIEKSIFENISFSDADAIEKELRKCTKIEIKREELLKDLLNEYDKLCQMRHAIVHSKCILAGKNATQLSIPPKENEVIISIGYAELQECASICTALVEAFNLKVFVEMAERWAIKWRNDDFWDISMENDYFSELWDIFSSVIARESSSLAEMTKIKCKNAIKREFHLI